MNPYTPQVPALGKSGPKRTPMPRKLQTLLSLVMGVALWSSQNSQAQAPEHRIVLIGDSTMAPNNGYGQALCERLNGLAECWNLAQNGRSTKSFRAEGLWAKALERMRSNSAPQNQWVLIQFGHNDQPGKPGRSTELETEYPANLKQYVSEARTAGLKPVLVTPLSRRSFKDGQHVDDLAPWALAMKAVAQELQVPLIDLHASSRAHVSAIGTTAADRYAVSPPGTKGFDRTHLGPLGACIFAEQVLAQLPQATAPMLKPGTPVDCEALASKTTNDPKN
jgi:lysophospholipase L1-like esterase